MGGRDGDFSSDSFDTFTSSDVRRRRRGADFSSDSFDDNGNRRYGNCWPNCSDDPGGFSSDDVRRARRRGRTNAYRRGYNRGRDASSWTSFSEDSDKDVSSTNKDVSQDNTDVKKADKVALA